MGQQRDGMRDRLWQLEEMSIGQAENKSNADSFSNVDLGDLQQQAVVFDHDHTLDHVFEEAQNVRREIHLIQLDVRRLGEQNSRILTEATMETIKQDSNAIASEIKGRGEGVLARLKKMELQNQELEAKHGGNAAVARIARTQYVCLSNSFRDAVLEYNETEMIHRQNCRTHIQRQLEIVGKEVTGEEVEDMIANGRLQVFSENVLSEGRTACSAYRQIESRQKDLLDLETRIRDIQDLFLDVATLVEEHGSMVNTIQANVHKTDVGLGEARIKLDTAKRYDRNNPIKKMFCGCFPCFK